MVTSRRAWLGATLAGLLGWATAKGVPPESRSSGGGVLSQEAPVTPVPDWRIIHYRLSDLGPVPQWEPVHQPVIVTVTAASPLTRGERVFSNVHGQAERTSKRAFTGIALEDARRGKPVDVRVDQQWI